MQTVPCIISLVLKAKIHCNKGKNSKVINPIAEPAPWILEDFVNTLWRVITALDFYKFKLEFAKLQKDYVLLYTEREHT